MGLFQAIFGGGQESGEAAVAQMEGLQAPDIEQMKLDLEQMVQQGVITPEEAKAELQANSGMADIYVDPRFKQSQLDSLSALQEIGREGMSAVDKAKMQELLSQTVQQEQGQRQSILQNAQQRGVAGSGLEMLSQMQNQQGAASRASAGGYQQAAAAQQARLQGLQAAGELGGQMQTSDFNQQAAAKEAQDRINAFNAQQKQTIGLQNVQTRNAAQQANLAEKQRLADSNTATRNQQQQYNKQLLQQDFENKYKKAGGVASAWQNLAGIEQQAADQNMKLTGTLAEAGAKAMAASDERCKKDIKPFDSSAFLDELTGYKYKYKRPEVDGKGKQVGVMAQDLEKTDAAGAVVEDESGKKQIDYGKLGGAILASLADMNERLKKIE